MTIIEDNGQSVLQSSITGGCFYQEQPESPHEKLLSYKTNSFNSKSNCVMTIPSSNIHLSSNSDNREFVCGWGAALINITVTFPMNKLMFRQMLHGISTARALNQLKKEGLYNLYRGILPPLCQKTISTSIMFGMFEQYSRIISSHIPSIGPGYTMAAAASLAGFTEAILCPFERIQILLQDKQFHGMYRNSLHCASQLRKFGIPEYYRGLTLILIRNGPSNVLFFGLRTKIKDKFPKIGNSWYENFVIDFLSGAFLGAFISTVMYPINVVKAHQQCQVGGPFQSVYATFNDVYNARGRKVRMLFKGVHVNYSRALVSWGIINASYEILLKSLYS